LLEAERWRSIERKTRRPQISSPVSYVQGVAGGGTADELSKLADLRDKGVITEAEFRAQKAKVLT
jgi:Short C-terminal domain